MTLVEINIEKVGIGERVILKNFKYIREKEGIIHVSGPTGSGKSTLLKTISGIIPKVYNKYLLKGKIKITGLEPDEAIKRGIISYIPQEPSNFFINVKVDQELKFANSEKVYFNEIEKYSSYYIDELSDGTKFKLLLMVSITETTKVMLLDEPSSHLDPWGLQDFIKILSNLSKLNGLLIFIVEHRTDYIRNFVNDSIILGQVKCTDHLKLLEENREITLLTKWNSNQNLQLKDLELWYNNKKILGRINLSFSSGSKIAIIGRNGAGKTSLLKCIAGLNSCKGEVRGNAKLYYIPQTPVYWFSQDNVMKELFFSNNFSVKDTVELARIFLLYKKLNESPYNLSIGEAKRLSLLKAFLSGSTVLLFDEPTMGLDDCSKKALLNLISLYTDNGGTVIVSTHDHDFVKDFDYIYLLDEGKLYEAGKKELVV